MVLKREAENKNLYLILALSTWGISFFVLPSFSVLGFLFGLVFLCLAYRDPIGFFRAFKSFGTKNLNPSLLFLSAIVFSLLFSPVSETMGAGLASGALAFGLFVPFLVMFALSELAAETRTRFRHSFVLGFGLFSLVAVFLSLGGDSRARLFFDLPLLFAHAWVFPFFLGLDFLQRKEESRVHRSFLVASMGVATLALSLTQSRTVVLALCLGIFLSVVLVLPRKRALKWMGALVIAGVFLSQNPAISFRLDSIVGLGERMTEAKERMDVFMAHPWLGEGVLPIRGTRALLNQGLEMASSLGLAGLISFLYWIYSCFTLLPFAGGLAFLAALFIEMAQGFFFDPEALLPLSYGLGVFFSIKSEREKT